MTDLNYFLEVTNEIVVLPVAIITFFLLMYIVIYLRKKNQDILRSRIFLKYRQFNKAFVLLAVFALLLLFHVSLIYIPNVVSKENVQIIESLQHFFGLFMILMLITFVGVVYRSIR